VAVVAVLLAGCHETATTTTPSNGSSSAFGNSGGAGGSTSADLKSLAGIVKIDGSSTLQPVSAAVAEEFQAVSRVKVTVGTSGTGGGFKKFCRGEIDIADASRPILKSEMDAAREAKIEYIELPVCFDALTVAVHPQNPLTSITVADLKKMWEPEAQGKVTKWNHVNPAWPDAELTLYGAGTDSGTFDYFTEAVCGKAKSSRGDYGANENDNVIVEGIAGNKNALGYLPFAYYISAKDRLKALAIDWEKGDAGPVVPSLENVLAGKYNPLSRPLFIYVNRKSAERPEVQAFVEFYLNHAKELAAEIQYLPLPDRAYKMGLDRLGKLQTGTGYGGEPEVGLPVEEILQREPKQ
jgi:phosphate transport system substrate-binding protein